MADLTIPQGKTWRVAFPIVGAFDPTGWAVRSEARPRPGSETLFHEWSSEAGTAGFETISADQLTAAGLPSDTPRLSVVLDVSAAVSSAWTWRDGYYDIEVSKGDEVLLVAAGQVSVAPEVTR